MNPLLSDSVINHDSRIIVALDFPDEKSTLNFVRNLNPNLCRLKVGKELFTASGRSLVEKLMTQGFDIFLDLKYHDIPNTVAAACRTAAEMGIWITDMHTMGGRRMMEAAANAVANYRNRPKLIGVTVLTSMEEGDLAEIGINRPINEMVLHLAQMAQQSGLDGTVSSAQEAKILRQKMGDSFLLVTPGIRLVSLNDDQRRTMTPIEAIRAGASYLVIGRPITRAENPLDVLVQINQSIM
ncbi:MAG: orotidine-5'-phosphate decarboxylase [Neisseriaceae bacterium]|nr:orotidine-5'-phosphate decarboxylase [Neisseriaceae bacterium]